MTTERPRIQVTLDADTNALLASFALQSERSLSSSAAVLIREALELHEDALLAKHADRRMKQTKRWVSHKDAWA